MEEQCVTSAAVNKVEEHVKENKAVRKVRYWQCGKMKHFASECRFKDAKCNFCGHVGHIAAACLKKKKSKANVGLISQKPVQSIREFESASPITQKVRLNGDQLQILGVCNVKATTLDQHLKDVAVELNVTSLARFNVLGRKTIRDLDVDIGALLKGPSASVGNVHAVQQNDEPGNTLVTECKKLGNQFSDLFKPEMGCFGNFELEVSFKPDAKPIFCQPRTVPFAILEDLNQAYVAGIKRGVWVAATQFNDYGTPVVPVRKTISKDRKKITLRVCGVYSVTVNPKLEIHRHPSPLPDDLMRKLSGGYYFTKWIWQMHMIRLS
uniref:CCHC-type domain-containing protein n=1 Tax=Trichuris muris TaxID=70415 RepID=A0A5S6QMW3_TRIMR